MEMHQHTEVYELPKPNIRQPVIGIVAIAGDRIIGDGKMIPKILKREDHDIYDWLTRGQVVVTGRHTFDQLPAWPSHRDLWVLTSAHHLVGADKTFQNPTDLPDPEGKEIFVCGGGSTFEAFLPFMDEIYMTHVMIGDFEGTMRFPEKWWKEFSSTGVVRTRKNSRTIHYYRDYDVRS